MRALGPCFSYHPRLTEWRGGRSIYHILLRNDSMKSNNISIDWQESSTYWLTFCPRESAAFLIGAGNKTGDPFSCTKSCNFASETHDTVTGGWLRKVWKRRRKRADSVVWASIPFWEVGKWGKRDWNKPWGGVRIHLYTAIIKNGLQRPGLVRGNRLWSTNLEESSEEDREHRFFDDDDDDHEL